MRRLNFAFGWQFRASYHVGEFGVTFAASAMDPAEKRISELTARVVDGTASEAEREELSLYKEERPDVVALVKRAENDRAVGGEQLVRAEQDRRIVAIESSSLTKGERTIGVGMVIGGTVGAFFFPAAVGAAVAGAGLLLWSVLRVQIRTANKDPYKDIEQ